MIISIIVVVILLINSWIFRDALFTGLAPGPLAQEPQRSAGVAGAEVLRVLAPDAPRLGRMTAISGSSALAGPGE